jgi:hypothetical protein
MLARITLASSPSLNTTGLPVTRSVATARNGIGSSSKLRKPGALARPRSTVSSWMPETRPFGSSSSPPRKPMSGVNRFVRSSALRRMERSWRGGLSLKRSSVEIPAICFSISGTLMPLAYAPPTIEPMLVPAMQSTGTRSSSSTFSTPMCAAPRAPPPESTRQIFGRLASGAGACPCAAAGQDEARAASANKVAATREGVSIAVPFCGSPARFSARALPGSAQLTRRGRRGRKAGAERARRPGGYTR